MQAWLYVHSNVSAMCLVDVTVATKIYMAPFPHGNKSTEAVTVTSRPRRWAEWIHPTWNWP